MKFINFNKENKLLTVFWVTFGYQLKQNSLKIKLAKDLMIADLLHAMQALYQLS